MSLPPSYNLLKQYPNKYYIETGIYRGDSLQMALDAGFEYILACDIDKDTVSFCANRFDLINFPKKMGLYVKNSIEFLEILTQFDEPATILLDAHWQMTGEKPDNAFPLMKELAVIMQSGRENDTIVIDDILYMTHPDVTGWKLDDIYRALRRINSKYKFQLIANPVVNNLLIATP